MKVPKFLTKTALFLFPLLYSVHGMDKEDLPKINMKADLRLSSYAHIILGENVWLRPVFLQDAPAFFPILTNPDKVKYLCTGRSYTTEECCVLIAHMACNTLSFSSHFPKDLFKKSVEFYLSFFNYKGPSGVIKISKAQDLGYENYLEIAYYGQGGTREAVRTVLAYLREFPFVATSHPENKASVKILAENFFKVDKENIPKYGSVRNYYIRSTMQSKRDGKSKNQLFNF